MKKSYAGTAVVQSKIDKNNIFRIGSKAISGWTMLIMFWLSMSYVDHLKFIQIAWIISLPIIFICLVVDCVFAKKNKTCEYEIYQLDVADLEHRKEMARIRNECLPDGIIGKIIPMPDPKVHYPILYYSIILVLDGVIRFMLMV